MKNGLPPDGGPFLLPRPNDLPSPVQVIEQLVDILSVGGVLRHEGEHDLRLTVLEAGSLRTALANRRHTSSFFRAEARVRILPRSVRTANSDDESIVSMIERKRRTSSSPSEAP